jgi:hypothetical protein
MHRHACYVASIHLDFPNMYPHPDRQIERPDHFDDLTGTANRSPWSFKGDEEAVARGVDFFSPVALEAPPDR